MSVNEPVEYKIKKNANPQYRQKTNPNTQENINTVFRENTNIRVQEINRQISETKRETILKPENDENSTNFSWKEFFKKNKMWWIIALIVLLIVIIISIVVPIYLKNKDKNNNSDSNEGEDIIIQNPKINLEEAKKIFSPSFKINTKKNFLTQLSQKSYKTYQTAVNGEKTTMSILNKAIYDIYTINSIPSSKQNKIIYDSIYTTIITVNSLCAKLSYDLSDNDCELEQYLDLNKKDNRNLRTNEENDEDLIKNTIIPICLIEHTDTNLIISMTCPENLDDSFKNDIIIAFQNIKPDSMKGYEYDKNLVNTITEEKDDKIYITSYDNICSEPNTVQLKLLFAI